MLSVNLTLFLKFLFFQIFCRLAYSKIRAQNYWQTYGLEESNINNRADVYKRKKGRNAYLLLGIFSPIREGIFLQHQFESNLLEVENGN